MSTTLHPKIWHTDDKINPEVRKSLLQIAKDFIKYVKVKKLKVVDVILTGSLANYSWNDRSDIDLHVVFNLKNFERHRKFLNEYLQTKKTVWNLKHEVTIYGFKVEVYPQDVIDPHTSTGVYSLIKDAWVTKPTLKPEDEIDKPLIKKKYQDAVDLILWYEEQGKKSKVDYKKLIVDIDKYLDSMRANRTVGIKRDGEKAVENIIYKLLRNNGFLEKLTQTKKDVYDKSLTVAEKQKKGI